MKNLKFGSVVLPIHDTNADTEHLVPAWDDGFAPDKGTLAALAAAVKLDLPVLLHGPTGCGKTSSVMLLASALNRPVRRMNLNGDVRSSDFLGEQTLIEGESGAVVAWRDGVVTAAMREGSWLILDEFDAAPASLALTIQAILEKGHVLTLSANGGEVVRPHPDFRVFATANTIGSGDESGLYAGTNRLNEATLDRFVAVECDYPTKRVEANVLVEKTGIAAESAKLMVEVAGEIREAFNAPSPLTSATFSTRRLLAWASLAQTMGSVELAYAYAVADKLGKTERAYVGGVAQRVTGWNVKR
jgi:cobaltochelatase CobS